MPFQTVKCPECGEKVFEVLTHHGVCLPCFTGLSDRKKKEEEQKKRKPKLETEIEEMLI